MTHWAIADRRWLARRTLVASVTLCVTLVTQSSSFCASREAADHQSQHAAMSRRKSGGLPQLWRDAASACNQLIKYQLELWQRFVETWSECRHSVLDVAFDQRRKRLRMYVTAENAVNFKKDHQMPSVGSPNTRITNPRWRTATILNKCRKIAISHLSNVLTDRHAIWDRWRSLTLLTRPLKFRHFKNPLWRRSPFWQTNWKIASLTDRIILHFLLCQIKPQPQILSNKTGISLF